MQKQHLGLTLSSEEHPPTRLVELAGLAEGHGFDFVSISDHFHPWIGEQGHSPFVWSVLGAIAERTESIEVAVGVTCPTMRIHPAIIAQAAATTALLLQDRFVFGVGTGEALNEHVLGDRWPPIDVRLDMLEESVEVMRKLWSGENVIHRGQHYTVENARLFDPPRSEFPLIVSAFGPEAAVVAARTGHGLWTNVGSQVVVDAYEKAGGSGPRYAQLTLCWAEDERTAVETAHRIWPNSGVPGVLSQDLHTVGHMEQATSVVTPEMIAQAIPCGPDPEPVLDSVREALDIGIDHIYFHQIGRDQEGFLSFWDDELRLRLQRLLDDVGF